jgi:PPOX class probable F420-dependent enzyme
MDHAAARRAVEGARVARLATLGPSGRVDLVPMTFALTGDRVVTAVDHKPKTTTELRRLDNIRARPEVTVLVDHYGDDWNQLWWVRLQGTARVVEVGAEHRTAVEALVGRYAQYVEQPPTGPTILIDVTQWRWWSAR